jgi:hypothetical protein
MKSHSKCLTKKDNDRRPQTAKDATRLKVRNDHLDLNKKGIDRHAKPYEIIETNHRPKVDKSIKTVKDAIRAHITGKHLRTARSHRQIVKK